LTPPFAHPNPDVLVTDFDGTITGREFYDLAVAAFLPAERPDYWSDYAAGRISHFEALSGIFRHLRCTEEELRGLTGQMEPDPDLPASIERLRAAGWDVVIVSNGTHWYIDPILESLGVTVPVYSSPGRFRPEGGLHMEPPLDSRYFNPAFGIDKALLVADLQLHYRRVAFAGNGSPDRQAALAVQPELRFARRWLANWLEAQGEPYRPFQRWADIARELAG
jgi:2,3-diketo-5-methylthio-1-phosphopentane phosphatase